MSEKEDCKILTFRPKSKNRAGSVATVSAMNFDHLESAGFNVDEAKVAAIVMGGDFENAKNMTKSVIINVLVNGQGQEINDFANELKEFISLIQLNDFDGEKVIERLMKE